MNVNSDTLTGIGVVGGLWLLLSSISSVWMYFEAQAAVKVRPNLADVGVIDAFLTGHGMDWLFYQSPIVGVLVTFGLYGVMGGVFLWFES